jgi:Ca2+-binding RTX toxin-like protein
VARFDWANGNVGFYGYDLFGTYLKSSLANTGMVMTHDPASGAIDPAIHAGSVEMTFAGATSYIIEAGPEAGHLGITGGTLTGIRYLAEGGRVLLSITNLAVALPVFLACIEKGNDFAAWSMIANGKNAMFGSNDASYVGFLGRGDVIATGTAADVVKAGGGDDFIKDQGGVDSYDGGTGFDTLAYDGWFFQPQNVKRGLIVDLAAGTVMGPDGLTDTITAIEAATGTWRNDQLRGDAQGNKFAGYAGADRIDGRGGFDFASYAGEAAQGGSDGIRVNLATGFVRDGFGMRDTLVSIEGVEGTAAADIFNDNGSNNFFDGGAGNDVLRFSAGNDSGHGGAGADSFVFKGNDFDDDTIDDFGVGTGDVVIFELATSFAQLVLVNVTTGGSPAVNVQFGSGSVTLIGYTSADLHADDFGF